MELQLYLAPQRHATTGRLPTGNSLIEPSKHKPTNIRNAVNAAIQQANKTPNAPKISSITINEKKSYILSTLGNTPASEILKYRANVEAALRKIDKSVLRIEGDKKWYRLIVHSISTTNYDDSME